MICHKKMNNVDYWQIKISKLIVLDQKSQIKRINYSDLVLADVKFFKNHVKRLQHDH